MSKYNYIKYTLENRERERVCNCFLELQKVYEDAYNKNSNCTVPKMYHVGAQYNEKNVNIMCCTHVKNNEKGSPDGGVGEENRVKKRIKMYYIYIPTPRRNVSIMYHK